MFRSLLTTLTSTPVRVGRIGRVGRVCRLALLACVSLLLILFVIPGCGRASLESDSSGQGGFPACGPATCPTGCCGSDGTCRTGGDLRACGSAGGSCSDCIATGFELCTASGVCGREDDSCDSTSCDGCCTNEGGRRLCLSGTEPAGCGRSGARCADCETQGRGCSASTRTCTSTKCDPTNCDGCCVGNTCLTGTTVSACGFSGGQCNTCPAGQRCVASGASGGRCGGTVTCGPQNCSGCCGPDGRCVAGVDSGACGLGGRVCLPCGANQVCDKNSGTCSTTRKCGPDNCSGCCIGNTCIDDTSTKACGVKGEACKTCKNSQSCNGVGACVDGGGCSPDNCAGCCVGDFCATGSEATACGIKGGLCQNCVNQGGVCEAGACKVPPCTADTCKNGCCAGNVCVPGTGNTACGSQGTACTNCASIDELCQGQVCVEKCGPSNCAGCCRANNTCNTSGIESTSCGEGGAACANCSASGSFCNGLVSPRQCNDKQTTCPAPYAACAGGVRTPVTAPLQKLCSDAILDGVAVACVNGPDSPACVAAFSALPPDCLSCLARFDHPFDQKTGLYACAASAVSAGCRHSMGCATQCAQTACNQCTAGSESQCYSLVNGVGECSSFDNAASCANSALSGGVCSQYSYASFGAWLRGVGDVFCGNGP